MHSWYNNWYILYAFDSIGLYYIPEWIFRVSTIFKIENYQVIWISFIIFRVTQPILQFSYKPQVDDTLEDDNVSLPHQQSFSSLKTDSDYIYQNPNAYDSTQFHIGATPVNPLYTASLQSPDSITGYSITSNQSFEIGGTTHGYQQNFSIQNT